MNYSDILGKQVFTTRGKLCGKVEDVVFDPLKIKSLVINMSPQAQTEEEKTLVVAPYDMVKAVSDVVIIYHLTKEKELERQCRVG